jgi:diguanylate cyclase (GGDEF)-like protein
MQGPPARLRLRSLRSQAVLIGLLIVFVLAFLGWDAWRDYFLEDEQLPLIARMQVLATQARTLQDLELVSARLALADGSPDSERAYRRIRQRLDGLVHDAARDYPAAAGELGAVHAADAALAAIHDRALALQRSGNRLAARQLLDGDEHAASRLAAIQGMDAFAARLQRAADVLHGDIVDDNRYDANLTIGATALLVFSALFALRLMQRWRTMLLAKGDEVHRQALELEQLNAGLEARVAERTRALEEATYASLNMMEDAVRQRETAARAHEKLDYLAYYDALTGLARRGLFLERVAQYERGAVAGEHKIALLLLDLERFKNINDSLGRDGGDQMLKQVAEWLTVTVGDTSLLGHLGADRFAIVLPEVTQASQAARLVESLIETLASHFFVLDGAQYRIAAKFGVALFPDDGDSAEQVFRNAEAALKKAKAGGERYLFYAEKMAEAVAGRLRLENDLRRALDEGEFVLHYQPKVDLRSGRVTGAEALIRWNDPRTGLVPPGRFIPVLEETGLINDVGRWALRQASSDYLRWRAAGLAAVRIAVNVSPLQLRHRDFVADIERLVGTDGIAAAGLELEITEGMIMQDVDGGIALLKAVRALGLTVAVDDFGTGYSSLGYLSKLPIDVLKIDRSFVNDIALSPDGMTLVSTIIKLAHSLKLKVVAEGVETQEQRQLLTLMACDEMQGFLFSKAVPAADFEAAFLVADGPAVRTAGRG